MMDGDVAPNFHPGATRVWRSFELHPILGPACRPFFQLRGQGGPSATDRWMSSIGALLPIAL
jgi:hypothetical protein